jgi:predicted transcriptional regulator
MRIADIVNSLKMEVKTGQELLDREVTGGYVSDMLSDVIAHAHEGDIWVTLQTHLNIIPVASMNNISAIVIVNGRTPDEDTLEKAKDEQVPILGTEMTAFQVVGELHKLGIRAGDAGVQG